MPRCFCLPVLMLLSGCAAPFVREFDAVRDSRETPPAPPSDEGLDQALTLERAVALARANNPTLREARASVEAAREAIAREGSLEEPRLQLETGPVSWSHAVALDQSMTMAGLRQRFPAPGSLELRAGVASEQALAELEETLEKENGVVAAVEAAFFDDMLAVSELAVDENHDRLLESILTVAEAHYRAGRVPQADVLKAQAARVVLRNDIVFVRQRIGVAKLKLNVLMGRRPEAPLGDPVAIAPRDVPESPAELQARAAERRPDVKAAQHALNVAERGRDLAGREAWLPELEVGVDYVYQPMEERDGWRAMLMINLPWLSAARPAAIREAERMLESRQAGFRAEQLDAAREVGEAYLAVRATRDSLALQKGELVPLVRQALDSLRTNYENNAASFIDLLDAERELLDAELGVRRAEAAYEQAVTELERSIGGKMEVKR